MAITLDYESIMSQLAYVINIENSASSLNADLAKSVATSSVFKAAPDRPILLAQYPAIVLEMQGKTEEFSQMGAGAASERRATVSVNIYNIVNANNSVEDALKEARFLTRNVETILRSYPKLNTTGLIDVVNPASTDFDLGADLNGDYVAVGLINIEMERELRNT